AVSAVNALSRATSVSPISLPAREQLQSRPVKRRRCLNRSFVREVPKRFQFGLIGENGGNFFESCRKIPFWSAFSPRLKMRSQLVQRITGEAGSTQLHRLKNRLLSARP